MWSGNTTELVNHLAIGSNVRAPGCLEIGPSGWTPLKGEGYWLLPQMFKILVSHVIRSRDSSFLMVERFSNWLNKIMLMKIWVKIHNMVALECKNILSMAMSHT